MAFAGALHDRRLEEVSGQAAAFISIVRRMVNFVCGLGVDVDAENLNYATCQPLFSRQELMKEQGILGTAMDVLGLLSDYAGGIISRVGGITNVAFIAVVNKLQTPISRALFQLLFYSVRKNPGIQRFAAKRLAVFVNYLESESVATRCIVEMLSENRELQEAEVSSREVAIFVSMLQRNPMHPLFLNMLRATCECAGEGVERNQGLVAKALLLEAPGRKLLMSVVFAGKQRSTVSNTSGLPMATTAVARGWGATARPLQLTGPASACNDISVTWEADDAFSAEHLFGKTTVSLLELTAIQNNTRIQRLERTTSIGSQ